MKRAELDARLRAAELRLKAKEARTLKTIEGAPGEKGERGEPGERGLQGETGPSGINGRDGLDGKDGARGPQGLQGERGFPGPQGERGEAGKDGAKGADGAPGERGAQGLVWLGPWKLGQSYSPGDATEHLGSSWVAVKPGSSPPGISPDEWDLLAKKGQDGWTGAASEGGAGMTEEQATALETATTDIAALDERLDTAEASILANTAADADLEVRVQTTEADIFSNTNDIIDLQAADTALDGRLDALEAVDHPAATGSGNGLNVDAGTQVVTMAAAGLAQAGAVTTGDQDFSGFKWFDSDAGAGNLYATQVLFSPSVDADAGASISSVPLTLRGFPETNLAAFANVVIDTTATLTGASKILSLRNNTVEKAYFDKDGALFASMVGVGIAPTSDLHVEKASASGAGVAALIRNTTANGLTQILVRDDGSNTGGIEISGSTFSTTARPTTRGMLLFRAAASSEGVAIQAASSGTPIEFWTNNGGTHGKRAEITGPGVFNYGGAQVLSQTNTVTGITGKTFDSCRVTTNFASSTNGGATLGSGALFWSALYVNQIILNAATGLISDNNGNDRIRLRASGVETQQNRYTARLAAGSTLSSHIFDNATALTDAAAEIISVRNGDVEQMRIDKDGQIENVNAGKGVILKSPDGTRYLLTIANGGTVDIAAA